MRRFAQVGDLNIHHKFIPGPSGRTFVFINSLGSDFRIWEEVVARLRPYGSILLADKRGHGLSSIASGRGNLEHFAEDALALMAYYQVENVVLTGISIGGMIAQALAAKLPPTLEKLILCDTSYRIGSEASWNERIEQVKAEGISSIAEGVAASWFSSQFRKRHPEVVNGYQNMLERTPLKGYIHACEGLRDANFEALTARIQNPTLCVVGEEDPSTTIEAVTQLQSKIPGAELQVIAASGHLPCADNPEKLARLIIDFSTR